MIGQRDEANAIKAKQDTGVELDEQNLNEELRPGDIQVQVDSLEGVTKSQKEKSVANAPVGAQQGET